MANTIDSSCIKASELSRWSADQKAKREKEYQKVTYDLIRAIDPDIKLSDTQLAAFRDLAKLRIGKDEELESLAGSGHIQSNWGQYSANPNLMLSIVQACKLVELAETMEDGVQTNTRYGKNYIEAHPKLEKIFAGMGKLHIALSILMTGNSIHTILKAEGKVHTFNALAALTTSLSDLGGDIVSKLDDWRLLPSMQKYTGNYKHFGKWAVGFSLLEGIAENATQARSWADPDVPLRLKIMGTAQAGLGTIGDVMDAIAMKIVIDRAEKGVKAVTPKLGALLIASAIFELATIPLDIESIGMQHQYANANNQLDKKFKEHGYSGYGLLRDFYKDKAEFDKVFLVLRKSIQVTYLGTSTALKLSAVGLPLALAVDGAAMILSSILDMVEQSQLEEIAAKQHRKILKWETDNPGKKYFSSALDAHYAERLPEISELAKNIQSAWDVNQVIAITPIKSNHQIRELATLVGQGEKIVSGKAYADVFKDGVPITENNVITDTKKGIIDISYENVKQALVFTEPIFVPGTEETRILPPTMLDIFRKNMAPPFNNVERRTKLIVTPVDWTINDKGTASTKVDLRNIIQRIRLHDGTLKKITINANMGGGDDWIIAGSGALNIDGGEGYDIADYSNYNNLSPIKVVADAKHPGKYTVTKWMNTTNNSKFFEEIILEQTVNNGRKTEKVKYRDFTTTPTINAEKLTDQLTGIEKIIGGKGNDEFDLQGITQGVYIDSGDGDDTIIIGNLSSNAVGGNDTVRGGKGNDIIKTREGDDTILQDIIAGDNDNICAGDGDDMINYSVTKPATGSSVRIKVYMNTSAEEKVIEKYINGQLIGKDTVKHVENLTATDGDDIIEMDDNDNVIYALGGDDIIKTFGGDDLIIGGSGKDNIDAGGGNDHIFQSMEQENDLVDGGSGQDTLTYGLTKFKDGHRNEGTWHMGSVGVQVDLRAGLAVKFSNGDVVDNFENENEAYIRANLSNFNRDRKVDIIKNIENIETTDLDDVVLGSNEANIIKTYDGNDQINARGGNDTIDAGAGNDIIYAGSGDDIIQQTLDSGNDTIDGGTGFDIVDYSGLSPSDGRGVKVYLAYGSVSKYVKKEGVLTSTTDSLKNIDGVVGTHHSDELHGNGHDNLLDGAAGDDMLCGYGGDDLLRGGAGNDTYNFFQVGNGRDKIEESAGDADTIRFMETIPLDKYFLKREDNNLVIVRSDTRDSITVVDHFLNNNHKIEYIQLHDGTKYQVDQLIHAATYSSGITVTSWSFNLKNLSQQIIKGTDEKNTINGNSDFNILDYSGLNKKVVVDLLNGYARKYIHTQQNHATEDTLKSIEGVIGTQYDDTVYGDDKDNLLDGLAGNDLIRGGKGNDRLHGGKGNDTYQFSANDGHNTIEDTGGEEDTIEFLSPIDLDTYFLKREGNNLVIVCNDKKDSLTVSNHFLNNKIEYIKLHDGTKYQVDKLIQNATYFSDETDRPWSFSLRKLSQQNIIKGADNDIEGGVGFNVVDYSEPSSMMDKHVVVNLLHKYAEKYILKGGKESNTKYKLEHVGGAIGTKHNDKLYGDDKDNLLDGKNGNNLLTGGKGNDLLRGGKGNDRYQFFNGDGHDTIEDSGGHDAAVFWSSSDGYSLHRQGNNLIILGNDNKDSVTVSNHFLNNNNKLEYIAWGSNGYNVNDFTNKAATLYTGSGTDWSFNVQMLLP